MQIIILGMHRSGTSAVSRVVNMMGAYLGPEGTIGAPASDNEKGFWERTDVKALNDEVLAQLGCSWADPVCSSNDTLQGHQLEAFEGEARRILLSMDAHRPWVMKDPRLCLLLPLWRPLLEIPVCVHVHRAPWEVAASLRVRNGFSLTRGLALWETYALSALHGSIGLPRMLVDYHALMRDPQATVAVLYENLRSAGVQGLRVPSAGEIRAFIDDRLFHQRAPSGVEDQCLNGMQSRLARALDDGSALSWDEMPEVSATSRDVLEGERQRAREEARATALEEKQANIVGEAEALRAGLAGAQEDREALHAQLTVVQEEHTKAVAEGQELREALDQTAQECETLRREAEHHRALVQVLEEEREELLGTLDDLHGDLRLLTAWLRQIEDAHTANTFSWRWRIGHGMVSTVERLLRRSRSSLAAEQMSALLRQYRDWYFDRASRLPTRMSVGPGRGHDSSTDGRSGMAVRMLVDVPAARPEMPDVLVFPVIDWHFRIQRPQHIARELAHLGHRVFYFSTTPRSGELGPGYEILESPEAGVFVCNLHHEGKALSIYERPMPDQARDSLYASMRLIMEECAMGSVAAIVDHPFWRPLAEMLPGCAMIYDCMDHHAGFSTHTRAMQKEEERLLQSADAVVSTSAWLSNRLGEQVTNTLIPNAADVDVFRAAAEAALRHDTGSRPVVGYVGTIAEWFDLPLVIAAAKAYPKWDFILVGSTHGCDTRAADGAPNIRFLGEKPYREVPDLVASFDVCIIPFQLTELILATNPVKVYEYLSAGKPVVAVDLPDLARLASLVHVAKSEADFIGKLATAMVERNDEALSAKRQAWAAGQDWSHRAEAFTGLIHGRFPKVSVVVLTYNNLIYTQACLESLERFTSYPDWELIIVDNASNDGTPDYLFEYASRNPRACIILNDSNLGFAAGNNCGIRAATGEHVVILNNDTYVTRGWLYGLVRHLVKDGSLGVVGPVTNNIGNEARIQLEYTDMEAMANAAERYTSTHPRELLSIDVAAFFCAAIRKEVIDRVGLLDEQFGIGFFEDDDYCRRVREAGYKVAVAEDVFVHHHLSATFSEMEVEKRTALFEKNRRLYERKWGAWDPHQYRSSS